MELTREQMYEMLWSDGVGKTEKALGLKRQELKKICEEYQIPRPSSQYWTAFKLDQSPQKTPLPASEENKPIRTEVYVKPPRVKKEKPAPKPKKTPEGKYEPRELPEEEPTTIYSVPEKLYAKDPVILDTKQRLREQNTRRDNPWSRKNPYKSTPQKWLDITVSQDQEDRALLIFSTVWRAAESKGYHLKISKSKNTYYPSCSTYFLVRNHEIRVQIKEINRRIPGEGPYSSSTLVGSGRLKFLCDRGNHCYSWNQERCAAQDTDHTRLEDKIEHIITVLEKIADERDQAEIDRKLAEERRKQEDELKRQEEERKRLEEEERARIAARREEEREKVERLLFDADRVKVASLIREYANQFEAHKTGKMDDGQLQEKLQWMREKADFMDPFIQRKDEWLTPEDIGLLLNPEITKTTEESHSSFGYGRQTTYSYWQLKNMWGHRK